MQTEEHVILQVLKEYMKLSQNVYAFWRSLKMEPEWCLCGQVLLNEVAKISILACFGSYDFKYMLKKTTREYILRARF